jgi:PEP-CTERM motif
VTRRIAGEPRAKRVEPQRKDGSVRATQAWKAVEKCYISRSAPARALTRFTPRLCCHIEVCFLVRIVLHTRSKISERARVPGRANEAPPEASPISSVSPNGQGGHLRLPKTGLLALATAALSIGVGGSGSAGANIIINTPAGLTPGDTFRIVFVTAGTRNATSGTIGDYNTFVTNDASTEAGGGGAVVQYGGVTLTWDAIGSTATKDAITNIGQTGAPVYLPDGTEVSGSDTAAGLWSGVLLHAIDHEIGGGNRLGVVWTGTAPSGFGAPLSTLGSGFGAAITGAAGFQDSRWVDADGSVVQRANPFYAISQALTVPGAVPEPATVILLGIAFAGLGIARKRSCGRQATAV